MVAIPDNKFKPLSDPERVHSVLLTLDMEKYDTEPDTDFTSRVERVAMHALHNEKDGAVQRHENSANLHVIAYWSQDRLQARVTVFRYKEKS